MIVKCKPVFNFQSVEFEMEVDPTSEDYSDQLGVLFDVFNDMLEGLQDVAPEQQKVQSVAPKSAKPSTPLATDGQKRYLRAMGIPFDEDLTKAEADNMIKKASGK